KIGVALPKATFSSEAEAKDARIRTALLDVHERACAFFQECLRRPEGARAREYLAGRGLDDDAIKKFRIGFAPDSGFLLRDRLKGQFSEEMLRESGLFSWKDSPQPSGMSHQESTQQSALSKQPNTSPARDDRAVEGSDESRNREAAVAQNLKPD